ncbi:MAG TPA: hypothetical protein V6D21_16375 [Candidatus Obscuribacterales bacterium]
MQVEQVENMDNVIQLIPQDSEAKPKPGKLVLTRYDLSAFLTAGALSKSDYIFLMIRLLYGIDQDVEINLSELADNLLCEGTTPLGKEKTIEFTPEDIQIELSKLKKKGLLESPEIPIQLRIQGL